MLLYNSCLRILLPHKFVCCIESVPPSCLQPCTKSLRDLLISHNRCGDNGLFLLKLGLLANRSIEKINLANTKMTCEGWLCVCVCVCVCVCGTVNFVR